MGRLSQRRSHYPLGEGAGAEAASRSLARNEGLSMSRSLSQLKNRAGRQGPLRRSGPARLSTRSAILVWFLLAALGWLIVFYLVPLLL